MRNDAAAQYSGAPLRRTLFVERERGFGAVLAVVAEVDNVAAAIACSTHTGECFGMDRQQKPILSQANILVVDSRFYFVQGELLWHAVGLHLNTENLCSVLFQPNTA